MFHAAPAAAPSADPFARWLTLMTVAYGVFVVYGSLVPLVPRDLDLMGALYHFRRIPYLAIGAGRRADWVANILLYIPLAFLWCARAGLRSRLSWVTAAAILACCLALAVAVEFVQLWFPPRTVSQNDLIAEALGSLIGVAVWLAAGRRLIALARTIAGGGQAGLNAAFIAYAGFYAAYTLFPFDFLVSGAELSAKLASDAVAAGIAPSCGGPMRCGVNLALEAGSFVPFGLYLALSLKRPGRGAPSLWLAALAGAFAGAAIEGLQIAIASGVSQGISIASRTAGMMAGVAIGRAWSVTWLTTLKPAARAAVVVGAAGYLLLLAALALRGGWHPDGALLRLGVTHWLPFYYHYYTTEQAALLSLLRNGILYAPVGLAVWVWQFAGRFGRRTDLPGGAAAFWLGALPPVMMETSRLMKLGGHADPTNVLIGAAAAWLAFHLAGWMAGCLLGKAGADAALPRRSFLR